MASINISSQSTSLLRSKMITNVSSNNGPHFVNLFSSNGHTSDVFLHLGTRTSSKSKGDGRLRASLLPIDGGFPVNQKRINANGVDKNGVSVSSGIVIQPDSIALGTLSAETTPAMSGFSTGADEYDLDQPTAGFSSIPEAIEDIRQGKMVVVVDDEDRENEGDLIMAASCATPEAMAFIVKHGTGIVCVSMKGEDLDRLELPLMVTHKDNKEKLTTAFTVSVDAKHGTTTGVSARDRAATIKALASKDSQPCDFNRPGHIFPLKYREGGVLKRAGHTEASVDLAMLAGFDPVAVLCEIVDDDGSMARLPKLREFAKRENLKIISIADLIRYEDIIFNVEISKLSNFLLTVSMFFYSESKLTNHLQILRDLGVRTMKLMTNNPAKYSGLKGYGLEVAGRVALLTPITKHNKRYLETKRAKMGHVYGSGNNGVPNLIVQNEKPATENQSD
ncbi:bifunctional riboflavin biosynthesis protein RIBA 1, chloroplastic [Artemisia annua]|uniref:Bifunctional riboflavin biosynthesis protein RIBA 1, chloroplastic n=1 Tax=Artemisia annua TaxID=35608 RepID=A0A2U1KBG0_ARTAN|nr:bifunctional riboflavin biosynthesis protein RIBA 1, chloroplastic [Artemisia annua]